MAAELSTKKKLVRGVIWNTTEKFLVKGSAFIIGVILARLLSPSDYGLLGMLGVFIALSNVFIESGFAKALIQRKECTDIDYSTAFIANIGVAVLVYILLFFSAPYISVFYYEPHLTLVTRVLGLNFIIGAFNIVQRAKLMAAMDFKSLAFVNFLGTIAGGVVGIIMAYSNFGVWSLVAQTIASTFVMSLVFPVYSKWRPSLVFSRDSFNHLWGFGSKLLISGVCATVINNIATIAIGRCYKSQQLGYYTRAVQYSEIFSTIIYDVLGTVTFPVMSSCQDDKEKMLLVYKKVLFFTALVVFPIMILLALLAKPLILLMLTEKWLPCVFLLQILCIARMFTPLSALNMNILNAIGRSDLFMKLDLSKLPLILLTLFITIPLGTQAIVIGELMITFICFFINAYLPGKIFGYGAFRQLYDWRFIILALGGMVVAVTCFLLCTVNPWVQLLGGGCIGVITYFVLCILFRVITKDLIYSFRK